MDSPTSLTSSAASSVYHEQRHRYFKDWYWYAPEGLKVTVCLANFVAVALIVKNIFTWAMTTGEIISPIFLLGLLGVSGGMIYEKSWFLPDPLRVCSAYRVNYREGNETLNYHFLRKVIAIVLSAPMGLLYVAVFCFVLFGPATALAANIYHPDRHFLALIVGTAVWFFILNTIDNRIKIFFDRILLAYGVKEDEPFSHGVAHARRLEDDTAFKNLEYDLRQQADKTLTFVLIISSVAVTSTLAWLSFVF